jgi:hypothetical protein
MRSKASAIDARIASLAPSYERPRNPSIEPRYLRQDRPDFSGLDPKGRRVKFFGDFFETPDAPPGGAHLERQLPSEDIHLQFVADTGSQQKKERNRVLHSMQADTKKNVTHARFLLGDLVYEAGVSGPDDPAITERVAIFSGPEEKIEAFAILGNHDLGKKKCQLPDAYAYLDEYRADHRTEKNAAINADPGISMINRYYDVTFRAATNIPLVQVILLDTNVLDRDPDQRAWLTQTLAKSKARHVIIAGHHPLKSAGPEHLTPPPFAPWLSDLAQQHKITAMFFGHEHNLQALQSKINPPQFIVGAGSRMDYPPGSHHGKKTMVKQDNTDTITAFGEPGFGTLSANSTHASLSLLKAKKNQQTHTLFQETVAALRLQATPTMTRLGNTTPAHRGNTGTRWFTISVTAAGLLGFIAAAARWKRQHHVTREERASLLPLVRLTNKYERYGSTAEAITLTV